MCYYLLKTTSLSLPYSHRPARITFNYLYFSPPNPKKEFFSFVDRKFDFFVVKASFPKWTLFFFKALRLEIEER